jgi:hypothetical protein
MGAGKSASQSSSLFTGAGTLSGKLNANVCDSNAYTHNLCCDQIPGTIESLALTAPTDRLKVLKQSLSVRIPRSTRVNAGADCSTLLRLQAESGGVAPSARELIKERGILTLYVGGLSVRSNDVDTLNAANLLMLYVGS